MRANPFRVLAGLLELVAAPGDAAALAGQVRERLARELGLSVAIEPGVGTEGVARGPSEARVPLGAAGVLVLRGEEAPELSDEHLSGIGAAVAAVLDRAREREEMAARATADRALLEAARFAASSVDLESVLDRHAEALATVSQADTCGIALADPEDPGRLVLRAAFGADPAAIRELARSELRADRGLAGRAFARGDVVVEEGAGTVAAVPLIVRGAVKGVALIARRGPLAASVRALLADMAHEVALAVEAAAEREAGQRAAERERLEAELRGWLRESFDLDRILSGAVERLGRTLHASRVLVALENKPGPGVRIAIEWRDALDRPSALGWVFDGPGGLSLSRATPPGAVACPDVELDPRFPPGALRPGDWRAFVLVPFRAGEPARGGLLVAQCGRARRWTDDEVRLVTGIAEHCAIAVERAEMVRDARHRAEELELIVSQMTDGVLVCGANMELLRMNAAAARIAWAEGSGVPDPSTWGRRIGVHDPGGRLMGFDEYPIVRAVRNGEVTPYRELVLRNRDLGQERIITCSATPLRDPSGRLIGGISIFRDVTEERAATAQVARTEKFRVLGELAAGVAHELNNVLAAVLGRAEVIVGSTYEAATRRNAEVIASAARDATHVLGRLTRLGHQKKPSAAGERVDLAAVAADAIELTRPRWARPAARIRVELEARPTQVHGVAAELREVLTNLILNSVDALPAGGSIRVTCGTEGDRARVVVADDGVGMTDEVLRRAFEPFFTTKGDSGTGLGLNISSAIVSAHGGRIDARSAPCGGTRIAIDLPALDEDATPRKPPPVLATRKRILVVDDDDRVRSLLADLLAAEGHEVTPAGSGEEALVKVDAAEHAFDVLVSDLAMPGMSGVVLAEEVKARRPATAVVLVSGWAAGASSEALARLRAALVTKPFGTDDVRRAVATALAAVS